MEFMDLIKERFSVRQFDSRPVEEYKLEKILEAGSAAPTAKNLQPQKVYVIQSEEALERIRSVCSCIYGASTVILMCYDNDAVWHNPYDSNVDSGEIDGAIVLTHMMLAAKDLGVDSCWVCRFDPAELKKAMQLPDNIIPVSIMPIGYAAEGVRPSERHSSRKAIEETAVRI